jgi:hypothetical protein
MKLSTFRCLIAAMLANVLVSGCDLAIEPMAPVRGKVTYRGVPLHTGTIVFTPDESRGTAGPMARAEIRAEGTYELSTADQRGARPGWYRVTIMAMDGAAGGYSVPRSLLPDKYRDPELSGLSCHVKSSQENVVDFNLE